MGLIQTAEGKRNVAYLDPVGIPTACYGHTGPDVRKGQLFTDAQCDALLKRDTEEHLKGMRKCVTAPVTNHQRDALVSFAFNVGVPKFCKSTMARKLNARDYIGAADEFPKWKYARVGGKNVVLRGLSRRRSAERTLFLTRDTTGDEKALSARLRRILEGSE